MTIPLDNKCIERPSQTRKSGNELFHSTRGPIESTLSEFWQWSASDLISNVTRGRLAEFIVAKALGVADDMRREWDAFDLKTLSGVPLEVKSCAYVQSWKQTKLSSIVFQIPKTRAWDPNTGIYDVVSRRQAEIYIFALLAHQEGATLDPLNLDQWHFYAVLTSILNERTESQNSIALKSLKTLSPLISYEGLATAIGELEQRVAKF
jgi:hypothetical protein